MALDPATAKAVLHVATKIVSDDEARKKALMILAIPIIGLLLIFAMILHILTMPFGFLVDSFIGDDLDFVKEMRIDTDYTQLIDMHSLEYRDALDKNFEGLTLTSGQTEVIYYSQLDRRWSDVMYGQYHTIGEAGCGPTAMAIIISTLTGQMHDPMELANWSESNGHLCDGNGSYHTLIPFSARAYGLQAEGAAAEDSQKLADALTDGKLVVALMGKGQFTISGHFIVLRGISDNGKILVADPVSLKKSEREWDFSIILKEARKGAAAGGPFWIISSTANNTGAI